MIAAVNDETSEVPEEFNLPLWKCFHTSEEMPLKTV